MNDQRLNFRDHRPRREILTLILLALPFGGCAANTDRAEISYSTQNKIYLDDESVGDRPPTANTLYAMARILSAQGSDDKCAFVLTRIIADYPRFMPAYCELAELHLRHHRNDDALATLSAGLHVSADDPILLNNLGMCKLLQSDYDEALSMFTRAAGIVPQDARYRANMAASLGMMGRYQESLSLYRQVVLPEDADYNVGALRGARTDRAMLRDPNL